MKLAKQNTNTRGVEKEIMDLNKTNADVIGKINQQVYYKDTERQKELEYLDSKLDRIISKELNSTKSITSDEMSTFMVKLFNEMDDNTNKNIKSIEDIFSGGENHLMEFFQNRYQNFNLLYEDLKMVTQQLSELEEAVMTTRDAIVTTDDISTTVSRTIEFLRENKDNSEYGTYINTVEDLEDKLKLQQKLKNIIIPNVLTYGKYYTYTVPYKKLFADHHYRKTKDSKYMDNSIKSKTKSLSESISDDADFIKVFKEDLKSIDSTTNVSENTIKKTLTSYTESIQVSNDEVSIPILEGLDIDSLMDYAKFKSSVDKATKDLNKEIKASPDGLAEMKESEKMFEDISGCYIKYIEPKKLIPIDLLDHRLGYYYMHDVDFQVNKSPFATAITVSNTAANPKMHEDVEAMFMSRITDKIVKSFDKKFLETNAKFKELILNALMYNDLYKRELRFQFIPAEYVVEYNINEDENGEGQSILKDSLFYAKLYLALLVFKMISIITKSNDTRVYYIKNSGIDQNITNKVQEVARSIKGRQINFMDLLNYNSIISKIGANKELFIPTGRSGERGIEFDILSGQDIPLNTDLMEMLHQNMVNGTGCPSVIMNFINEADYAKTLVMANSKFLARVISLQIDLNEPTTQLYKLLIKHSNISISEEAIDSFEFKFNTPKTLNTNNLGDLINNTDVVVNAAIKASTGESADQSNDDNRLKDRLYNRLFRKMLPMIDWTMVDEEYRNAKLELAKEDAESKINKSGNNSNEGY